MKIKDLEGALSLLDAARAARLHPSTIRRAIQRGELRHFRVFGRIRVRPDELERFVFRTYPMAKNDGR